MVDSGEQPKRRWWWWRWVGMLVGIWVYVACGTEGEKQTAAVSLTTLDGRQVTLADYRGAVVLVNFWATWCGPCREEMPALDAYYQAHQGDGFVLLAVNAGEKPEKVRAYITQGGYTFPVFLDLDGAAAAALGGVRGMPTSILDTNGAVIDQHVGAFTEEMLATQVAPLLDKP